MSKESKIQELKNKINLIREMVKNLSISEANDWISKAIELQMELCQLEKQ